ncbi:MAG: hypothetical protein L3K05_06400, partial [Thermoplasmata archaeon]|nr:hypothetical protein [Thermoplasmata archaeon]
TVNNEVRMVRGEATAVNATPARVLVWPGAMAGEDYDPFTQTHYDTYSGQPKHALTNEDQFVQLCKATHCTAIVQVPAEIDNASFAEAVVNYTEVNLSFHPAYWMIGNEPELWSHWKEPWKVWPTQSSAGPDPVQFAHEVLAYVKAIRAVDNTTPILGLPASGCTCGSWTFPQWISGVLNVTGSKIQSVAFHEYPAGWLGTGDGSLEDFYGTIQSAAGIPPRLVAARAAVTSSCPGCNVSVFISELGAALSWSAYGQYSIGFSGPLSLASQITQSMDLNLTNVDLFATELTTTNSWFNNTGHARVDYSLYTGILNHLGTEAFPVNITGLGNTIYGIDTIAPGDHGRRDLMVVNDNITHSISFAPRFAESSVSAPVEAWSWNGSIHATAGNGTTWVEPYTPQPVPHEFSDGLPGNYTLPPQSLVLFEMYPSGATYVRVLENGVPAPTAWYASVGPQFYGTTADNISLLLPAGSYPVASVPIPLPIGGRERTPIEQLAPNAPSPFQVSGSHANVTVTFLTQWAVNASASPAIGGTVAPNVGWWNSNESLNLTATPTLGYAFVGWSGFGPGNYSGGGRTATLTPTGRVSEKARFVVGNQVVFEESGLTAGTPWSVDVRSFTSTSISNLLTVYEPNGHFGFSLSNVAGFRTIPRNGSFSVAGGWSLVHVRYDPITPPQPQYQVTFQIAGLPSSMTVAITVRNVTETTGYFVPQYQLGNGTYAYRVGAEPGYHVAVPDKTFVVNGGSLVVTVPFVPTVYTATWEAAGTHPGLNWSVVVNGLTIVASSAWVSTSLPNGTYPYAIVFPANYTASPSTGVLSIGGSGVQQPLAFSLAEYRTWFDASGLGSTTAWSVRLGNSTQGTSTNRTAFLAANGTYTFDVHAPTGYYAVPSHGTLTISGSMPSTHIQFYPVSELPSAALVAALSSGALMTSIWIGGSIFVGFAAVRGLRRRDG